MPPKQRFTKDKVLDAAFELLRNNGESAIGARQIAAAMHCSTQPIFSCFANMEELNAELIRKAKDLYNEYVQRGLKEKNQFKGVGMNYLAFARNEPYLFKLLFMQKDHRETVNALDIDENRTSILESVKMSSGLDDKKVGELYFQTWIFTHGIAAMIATGTVDFTDEQLDELLSDAFIGLMLGQKRKP